MKPIWSFDGLYTALTTHVDAKLQPILTALAALQAQGATTMADITQIQADEAAQTAAIQTLTTTIGTAVTTIQADNATIAAQSQTIADLKAQIAAGSPVTQAQLDALDAAIVAGTTAIQSQTTALGAVVAPAPPVTPTPAAAPVTPTVAPTA